MKKNLYGIGMLAVAALAFASCNREVEFKKDVAGTHVVTVNVTKDFDTRTAIVEGATQADYIWTEGDEAYFHIYENDVEATSVSMSIGNDGLATFTATFPNSNASSYVYTARYFDEESNNHNPLIKATQKPALNSFDPSADVLIAVSQTKPEPATTLQFALSRVVSVNKMTLKGLTEGEKIVSVELASTDKNFSANYVLSSDSYSGAGKKLTFDYSELSSAVVGNDGTFPVYFVTAPVTDATFSVKVTTDQNVYLRDNFNSKLTFTVDQVKRFGIQLGAYGTPISTDKTYVLVESVDDLYDGASYIIVATNAAGDEFKAAGAQGDNNRAAEVVTVETDGSIILNNTTNVHSFTLGVTTEGYTFGDNDETSGYLYAAGTKTSGTNYLRSSVTLIDNAYWNITIGTDGEASITNVNNTYTPVMQYNRQNSFFSCYNSASQAPVFLYVDVDTMVELEDPSLVFLNADEPIEVEWDERESFVAPQLVKPEGLVATYSSENEEVATVDASTGEITFVGNGETVIFARTPKTETYKAGEANYTLIVTGAPAPKGESADNPFTVAEAVELINTLEAGSSNRTEKEYFVSGVISEVVSYSSQYHSLTYNITADGNASSVFIQVYSGKGLNGANFNSTSDLSVGDAVIVKGHLMKYVSGSTTTPEIYQNSQIVSRTTAPYFQASLSSDSIAYDGGELTLTIDSNTSWTVGITGSTGAATATLSADSGSNSGSVTVTIPENQNGATYTLSFTAEGVSPNPENLVITQSEYVNLVVAVATFTGKKSGGMTSSQGAQTGVRRNVTAAVSSGLADATNDHIRVYKNATLTLSVPSGAFITGIEFTGVDGNPVSNFGNHDGLTTSGNNGSWTGSAQSVTFTASANQVRLAQIDVTYRIAEEDLVNYVPSISVTSANPMSVANTAGTQTITYLIDDGPADAVLTGVTKSEGANWISNINYSTSGTVSFDVTAQETGAQARSATLTLKYTGAADVTVTVNQDAGPSGGLTKQYQLTISASDFNTTSYAANNNEKTSTAVASDNTTTEVRWTSNQVMKNGTNMQWQKSNGYIFNSTDLGTIKSVTVNSSAGTFTTYYGTSEHPTSGTTVGNGFFTVKVGSATGTTSSVVIVFEK